MPFNQDGNNESVFMSEGRVIACEIENNQYEKLITALLKHYYYDAKLSTVTVKRKFNT